MRKLNTTTCNICKHTHQWLAYPWVSTLKRREHNRRGYTECPSCGAHDVETVDAKEPSGKDKRSGDAALVVDSPAQWEAFFAEDRLESIALAMEMLQVLSATLRNIEAQLSSESKAEMSDADYYQWRGCLCTRKRHELQRYRQLKERIRREQAIRIRELRGASLVSPSLDIAGNLGDALQALYELFRRHQGFSQLTQEEDRFLGTLAEYLQRRET